MSERSIFWSVLAALIVFNWLHPFSAVSAETKTAYFLPLGHIGQRDYLPAYRMVYSADRVTQSVVVYEGVLPGRETNCIVLSTTTWGCDGLWADSGDVTAACCVSLGQPAQRSVSWLRYYLYQAAALARPKTGTERA